MKPTYEQIHEAADKYVFVEADHNRKWSNNDDTAGDNFGSFKAGANWAISQMQPDWVALKIHDLPESEKYYSIWRKGYSPEETVARLTFHDRYNIPCFIDNSMNIYQIGKIATHYKPLSQPTTK